MTIDQDTPVAASQPATDASLQEVSKPKRSTTTRSKAKPAAKPATGKTASGKAASKSSESTSEKDSSDSKGASDSKAAKAESASSKTTASKAAAPAKAAGRSATKTTKTTAAKGKKTADASKEISGSTADAVAPKSTVAPAAEAPKTAGKTAGKAAAKTASKTSAKTPAKAAGKTAGKAATPRKAKAAEAIAPEATAKTAETPAGSKQEAAQQKASVPQKPAAKAPKGRPAKAAAAKSSAKTAAHATAQTTGAAPTETAPKAESPATDKPAVSAALTSPAPVAQSPVKAAEPSAKQASEQISDKPAEAAPRHNAPAVERTQGTGQAVGQIKDQAANQPAERASSAPAAQASQSAEQAAESDSTSASSEAAAGDGPRRKNRRGRRGGRGRNRKKELNGQEGAQTAEDQASTAPLDEDDDALDLTDGAPEQASRAQAQDTRAQNAPRQNRPPKQGKPQQQQQQQNKPENGKPAEGSKSAEGNKPANAGKAPAEAPKGKRRMFISVLPGEQVEVALAEDGQLLEYYLDMLHQRKIKGNIYKGVIHNIDTNLQAAFVSYGAGKNGFLQIDEVHPEYWLAHHEPTKGKKFPPIQKVLKAGQEVLVQVVKEPTGSKGAFLTTWLSLAGRFLVLTPGQDQIGVSRKVDDDEERSRLREMMNGIDPGQGLGVIVRTVSAGTTKTTLKNDLQYLKRVWRDIRKKATEVSAPTLIYQEPGLSERAVRDYLTEDVCEIWVDNDEVAQSVRDTVNLLFPRRKDLVRMHTDLRTPMWERFNLRRQLEQIYSREVLLPSGGRLVFDQTEALMAIDINSGKISGKGNFEAMAHKTNMEAAEAIARHLKLRDIGGQVVIDFIEMRDKKHVLEVEKTLRTAMKNDRARHDVARMSSFGLLELVRQRTGSSALAISLEPCPACGGTGMRRNIEWQALQALRELRRMVSAEPKEKCVFPASPELALYLLNHKRDTLREIEQDYGKCLEIMVRP